MYIGINKEFFEKNKADAFKQGISEVGEDNTEYLWSDIPDHIEEVNYDADRNELSINWDNNLGTYMIYVPIDDDLLIEMMQLAVKRMNKIKSAIESLK